MSLILFYDTETTGFPKKGRPLEEQPYVVQLAAEVVDMESGRVVHQMNSIINWGEEIPAGVAEVHKITTEFAQRVGRYPTATVQAFFDLCSYCDLYVGHNEQFDGLLMDYTYQRVFDRVASSWVNRNSFCTMEAMRDICKLPPTPKMKAAGLSYFKSPKLQEAYVHCFGKEFDGAHDAMADVQACRKIYMWLKEKGLA